MSGLPSRIIDSYRGLNILRTETSTSENNPNWIASYSPGVAVLGATWDAEIAIVPNPEGVAALGPG